MKPSCETARITEAIARNTGRRWCSSCQADKPIEGGQRQGCRWRCAACHARSKVLKKGRP